MLHTIPGTARKKNIKPMYNRGCASASRCSGPNNFKSNAGRSSANTASPPPPAPRIATQGTTNTRQRDTCRCWNCSQRCRNRESAFHRAAPACCSSARALASDASIGVAADAAAPLSMPEPVTVATIGIDISIDLPHSSSSNLSDAYAQPRPRPDRHDTYTKCSAITTCDAMLDVSWLSKRTLKFWVTEKETSLAKGLPHTTDPIASKSRTSARTPYAQRRSAGGSCASLSQHMADSAAISTAQLHIRDIA